eukprot:5710901-Prymnesium_polylepis.1
MADTANKGLHSSQTHRASHEYGAALCCGASLDIRKRQTPSNSRVLANQDARSLEWKGGVRGHPATPPHAPHLVGARSPAAPMRHDPADRW